MNILSNAYETIVANGNHSYVLDPMNNTGCECPLNLITKKFDSVLFWDLSSDDGYDTAFYHAKTPDLTRTKRKTRCLWTKTGVFRNKIGMD